MDRKRKQLPFRELTGFVLLVALLLGGLLSSFYLTRHHQAMADKMDDAGWYALSRDWNRAKETAGEVTAQWQKQKNLCAVFMDHTPMGEIDAQLAQLKIYAAAGEAAEYAALCGAVSRNLMAMAQAQHLSWQNLL